MMYNEKNTSNLEKEHLQNYLKQELYELVKNDEKIFDFIQETVLDGIWFWDLDYPENEWMSPRFWITLGYDPEKMPHKSSTWQHIINKEDLKSALKNFTEHYKNPYHPYDQVVRYTHKLGHTIWIQCRGLAIRDEKGVPIRMIGAHTNITHLKKSKQDLKKQLKRYEHIIEGANLGIWEWNIKTNEVLYNKKWAEMLGYSLSEISSLSRKIWHDLIHPDDLKVANKCLSDFLENKSKAYECEIRMKHKSGRWIWILDKGQVISKDKNGNTEWLIGSHLDITKTKELELASQEKQTFLEAILDAINVGIVSCNEHGELNLFNKTTKKWHGIPLESIDIESVPVAQLSQYYGLYQEDAVTPLKEREIPLIKTLREGSVQNQEIVIVPTKGEKKHLIVNGSQLKRKNGEVFGAVVAMHDITERKEVEIASFEKQAFLQTVLDSVDVGLGSCDSKGNLTIFNEAIRRWFKLPDMTVPTSRWSEYYGMYKADGVTMLETEEIPLVKALNKGNFKNYEVIITPHNGEQRLISANGSQLIGSDGSVVGAVVALHDITHRKEAEEKLRISEEAFRGNFENAAIGMGILSMSGQWLKVNNALSKTVGYSIEELHGYNLKDITHPHDLDVDLKLLQELKDGKKAFYHIEKRYLHKNGNIINVISSVSMVRGVQGVPLYFVSQVTDITPRVQAVEKLKETVAKLEGVLAASSQVAIIGMDCDGIITSFNKGAENLLGYSREEMSQKHSLIKIHLKKEVIDRKKELSNSFDRTIKDAEIFTSLINKEIYDTREWTYVKKDGTRFPVQSTITAVRDDDAIIGYLVVATDISSIKKAEKELKSLMAVTGDQNKRLRNFAHIVSHNLRSHSGNFEMLLDLYLQENPEQRDNDIIKMFKKASVNLSETILHLNEVVSINTSIKQNLLDIPLKEKVNEVIHSVVAIAQECEVEINNQIASNIQVSGIPAYIDSVILNLLTNSIKYSCKEGPSFVTITAIKKRKYIEISFTDNGLGIDLNMHGNKLFGMYKTFHHNEDARGIGLFICKNQVEAMGGSIHVQSKVNRGSTFKIRLKYEKN